MADEALLESLLDAKHKPVRLAAAHLLSCLPESALAARMIERVQPLLAYTPPERGLLKKKAARLEVKAPEEGDAKALARDGVDTGRKRGSLGPKAATLAQMLGSTPLAHWTAQWGAAADAIVPCAADSEWHEALVLGWTQACVRQGDASWAQALLQHLTGRGGALLAQLESDALPALMGALAPDAREAFLIEAIEAHPKSIHDQWGQALLAACRHAWSLDFSRRLLAVVRRHYLGEYHWTLRALLPKLAVHFAPDIAPEIARDWPTDSNGWAPADQAMLDQLAAILDLRKRYLQELAS
jgi:hypothetical protein